MTLSTGTQITHYEITSQIGKGGMGEVYQAKDTKLGRDVAIKVLPEEFAQDADRVARFQREAKLLASLNHPNIAAIYGLEESGGTNFLVMELVEGNTLDARIKSSSIPVEETLKLALQIAEALEAAHEKGVIHRDLKPANIKVTLDDKVKVLDFGLAKAFAGDQADLNLSNSPTLSVAATQQGVILGTAAYMSPEQARGKEVDKRADIWAFGVVLFEMLTGKQVFTGDTVSDTLASVLAREPEWQNLPANLHPRIRLLLERCLKKEPTGRYRDIGDARADIQEVLADPRGASAQPFPVAESRSGYKTILPWIAALLGIIIVGTVVWILRPKLTAPQVTRFPIRLPEGSRFSTDAGPFLAISPDGSQLAVSTSKGIYLRSMDELNFKLVAGTMERTIQPFFSPDGESIGYWSEDDSRLKIIPVAGGTSIPISRDPSIAYYHWGEDGNIYYAGSESIKRVSKNGGDPETLIQANNGERLFSPQLLPDGKSVLFTIDTNGKYQIAVQSIDSKDRKILFDGATALYLPTGHLIYTAGNNLIAVPFDIDKRKPTGRAVSMVEDIPTYGPPHFCVSNSGTFACLKDLYTLRSLVWVDLHGNEEILNAPPKFYSNPRVSPDGARIAFSIQDNTGNNNIGVWDIARASMSYISRSDAQEYSPNWLPDSRRIVLGRISAGSAVGIYRMSVDGTEKIDPLHKEPGMQIFPSSLSKDMKILLGSIRPPGRRIDNIGMLTMGENPQWRLLWRNDEYNETQPRISPDGEWIAYTSNESGHNEVYVRSLSDVERGRPKISINGGDSPIWSRDGSRLYYRDGDRVMAASVETKPEFRAEIPKVLFQNKYYSSRTNGWISWDIDPNGGRFLMMKETSADGTSRPGIDVTLNWFEELKKRVPVP
ncbi:MAG: serine/threonine-protein kinase [Acidobacteria bacterium]|nr:serine/threonine-protein kinase [Acidobacteriota bacterium]